MSELVATLNYLLAIGGIVAASCAMFIVYDAKTTRSLAPLVKKYGLAVAFLTTLSASMLTLLYSEIFGFVPCGLCWLQRVFTYSQVFVTGTALWLKDSSAYVYGIVLSIPGLIVALYQHYLQMGGAELLACPTAGEGVNCADRFMFEFGFVTFPLLSTFLFCFLIALYYYMHTLQKTEASN